MKSKNMPADYLVNHVNPVGFGDTSQAAIASAAMRYERMRKESRQTIHESTRSGK